MVARDVRNSREWYNDQEGAREGNQERNLRTQPEHPGDDISAGNRI